jgi:adenylate cyclase
MVQQSVARKLVAILSADVVGYSRLMEADEKATIARLNACRHIIDGLVGEHHGRVFGSAGDSVIAEFISPVEAVRCAIDIQREIEAHNAELPEDRGMRFRIGVNLGDVVVQGDDLLGDGVNVAARLQALGEPGGICISGPVFDQVEGKIDHAFENLGAQRLKNIARPVRVYRVGLDETGSAREVRGSEPLPLPDKPSIAVLPFVNMSGDPEQEHFSDGIAEDIITELSRFHSLFVIARNSSFHYKGRSPKVQDIGRELGVQYVAEGSIRRAGNRVRITAQLVEARTGNHVWAERYDRELEDIFAVQDEVTQAIVAAIEPELAGAERERALRKPPDSLDAWESYQRGLWHFHRYDAENNAKAQAFFRQAIGHDPDFASAHASLAYALYVDVVMGFVADPGDRLSQAHEAARTAVRLDAKDAFGHAILGRLLMMQGEHEDAVAACRMAVALNPNYPMAHYSLGLSLTIAGRPEEAVPMFDQALRLTPHDPLLWSFLAWKGIALMCQRRHEEALAAAQKAVRLPTTGVWAFMPKTAALAHLGRTGEARAALRRARELKPDLSRDFVRTVFPWQDPEQLEHFIDGLEKAGLAD